MAEAYKSRAYTDRPAYADFEAPAKFNSIQSIIARRLREYPKAICSYSGGSDSDIMIDLIERVRKMYDMPPIKYVFFNTGLEMEATKRHVREAAEKYGVEIEECRPKVSIVQAARAYGIPFMSKIFSERLSDWQKKDVPLSVADEFFAAKNKSAKRQEFKKRYPKCAGLINFICGCTSEGELRTDGQLRLNSETFLMDFLREFPPDFQISAKCCTYCKKSVAHRVQKTYDIVITGERIAEGGARRLARYAGGNGCFVETASGQYRLRPLYWVSDADKAWYKDYYGIRYSDAYEVYGLTRTGCCGCPISCKAVGDLEKIRPYEPNVVKAAWNIFGKSYEYRALYNAYKEQRKEEAHENRRCN